VAAPTIPGPSNSTARASKRVSIQIVDEDGDSDEDEVDIDMGGMDSTGRTASCGSATAMSSP